MKTIKVGQSQSRALILYTSAYSTKSYALHYKPQKALSRVKKAFDPLF